MLWPKDGAVSTLLTRDGLINALLEEVITYSLPGIIFLLLFAYFPCRSYKYNKVKLTF
jgi:ABC-type Fe3+ transport system permease subunit